MKNLLKTYDVAEPTPTDSSDGIVDTSTQHLKGIKYPNRLDDVAVVGKLRNWHRSFLLRPRYGGRFLFMMYPEGYISRETILHQTFTLQAFNSAPALVDMVIPGPLQLFDKWEWKVFKTEGANEEEEDFEDRDGLALSDGMLWKKCCTAGKTRCGDIFVQHSDLSNQAGDGGSIHVRGGKIS